MSYTCKIFGLTPPLPMPYASPRRAPPDRLQGPRGPLQAAKPRLRGPKGRLSMTKHLPPYAELAARLRERIAKESLPPGAWIGLAHTQNFEAAEEFRQEAAAHFPGFDIHVDQLPISIATHIGPGSLALTCTKVLPGGMQYK